MMAFRTKEWLLALLFVILAAAFFLRLFPIRAVHWWDETVYLQHAEIILSDRDNYSEMSYRSPLLPIFFAAAFSLYDHIYMAHIVVALFGILIPLSLFMLGKWLYGISEGLIAAFFGAFATFVFYQSRTLLPDAPSVGLLGIGLVLLFASDRRPLLLFFSGLFFAAAVLMKLTLVIALIIVPLYFLLRRLSIFSLILFCAGAFVGLLPFFIWAQVHEGFFLQPFLELQKQILDADEPWFYYLTHTPPALPIAISAGLALFAFFKRHGLHRTELFLLILAGAFVIYLSYVPHKELRYILPALPPLLLFSAHGLASLYWTYSNRAVSMGIAMLLVLSFAPVWNAIPATFVDTTESDEKIVADYISQYFREDVEVFATFNYPVFAYYSERRTVRIVLWRPLPEQLFEVREAAVIVYKNKDFPDLEWLRERSEKVYAKGDIVVYHYTN